MNAHEEQMRQEFKTKANDTLKDLLNQNDVIVEEKSENSSFVDSDFESQFFKNNLIAKLKTLKEVTGNYIKKFEDSKYWADVDKKNRDHSPSAPEVDKKYDKMNVSTFTSKELKNMAISEGDASVLEFDQNQ